jgi:hypothetical protein
MHCGRHPVVTLAGDRQCARQGHWFNPSIAHHSIAWSKAIFRVLGSWPRQFQDNGLTAGATIVCVELKSTMKIERYRQQKK